MNNPDIADRDDIRALLVAFYTRAYADDLLGTIFTDIARMDLDAHLPTMCDFWETVLFRSGTYRGNAYIPHAELHEKVELTWPLFERWLELWRATVDERYAGPRAERAKLRPNESPSPSTTAWALAPSYQDCGQFRLLDKGNSGTIAPNR